MPKDCQVRNLQPNKIDMFQTYHVSWNCKSCIISWHWFYCLIVSPTSLLFFFQSFSITGISWCLSNYKFLSVKNYSSKLWNSLFDLDNGISFHFHKHLERFNTLLMSWYVMFSIANNLSNINLLQYLSFVKKVFH